MRGGLTFAAVTVGQKVQRAFDVVLFAVDLEHQTGDGFVKQLVPRGGPDNRLIVQELFQLIRQLIGAHGAQAVKHGFIARKVRIGVEFRGQNIVGDAVDFQRIEHQRRREGRDLVLTIGQEFRTTRVHGVLVIAQARKGHDAPADHVDLFIALNTGQHLIGAKIGQLALIIGGKGGAFGFQPPHIAGQFRRVLGGVQIAEIPFRQVPERRSAARVGIKNGTRGGDMHRASFD